jgi:catechol 2,3-dioxygenase-like lactoylglutathione lyase family enzyme
MRIRQIVFAARNLAASVAQFESALGLQLVYRDPEVAKFGLENALMRIGDQFIEVVAPTHANTAAGRHLDRHGDSAYMLILQTDDLTLDRTRLERLGVRVVWESSFADIRAAHLHPQDIGAAIVSLDEATPPASWRWAGPNWEHSDAARGRIIDATIRARDPAAMARRWSEVLDLEPPHEKQGIWRTSLREGTLNFVASSDGSEKILEYGLETEDLIAPVVICGTTFRRTAPS